MKNIPIFTEDELKKVTLSPTVLEHYSKPDEIKCLILEREYYKMAFEFATQNLNKCIKSIDTLDTLVFKQRVNNQIKLYDFINIKYKQEILNKIIILDNKIVYKTQ